MKIFLAAFFLLHSSFLIAQDSITNRIVLIGDAGQLTNGRHPVALAVKRTIPMDELTTIVYLGDNLYKVGLPDDEMPAYKSARAVLDSQLSIAQGTKAKIYMIPGNHDWHNGARFGYDAVVREQLYVDILNKDNVKFYPEGGCPGPVDVVLGEVVLVIMDSQWWLHPYEKPGIESDCDYKTKDEVLAALDDIFSRYSKKLIVFAVHHTFRSSSPHGGFYTWKQHLFPFTDIYKNAYIPLPLIGSIYPITRGIFGTPQDLKHPNYQNMIDTIQKVAKAYKNIIFAGGHDHSLQLIKDSNYYYITSGSGAKINRVYKSRQSLFAAGELGFATLEISKNKNVRCNFYTVAGDTVNMAYSENLMNFTAVELPQEDSINRQVEDPFVKYKDTITISASEKYQDASPFKRFLMGNNYREEWSTPVNMKVFNLRKEKGGLQIVSLGGGKQTRSLKLVDPKGKEWTLRSVEKDPTRAIPETFRPTIAREVVKDFISASHPYAAMAMPKLADAIDVRVPRPELFFVPDDPAFGAYRNIFKNSICLLEEREPTKYNERVFSTTTTFHNMLNDNDHRVDELSVLRARLLDMMVADFDRHADQWKWAQGDTGQGKLYTPISRDHDQAFFYSDGLLIKLVTMKNLPFLKGLRYDIPRVEDLNEVAKDFDRMFLTDLDEEDWKTTIQQMQRDLTDDVINAAVRDLPKEVYGISGEEITRKLISRRNLLEKKGLQYYRFISKTVDVVGSNEKEYFLVTSDPSGLNVKVYERKANNDTSFLMYDRTFDPKVTKEIRLYGLNNDDLFDIGESANSSIKLRIIGGKGHDTFNIKGHVRNYLYDNISEGNFNFIKSNSRSKSYFSSNAMVNYYTSSGYRYNETSFPNILISVNNDDGFVFGSGFSRITYGFRKEPYATHQRLTAIYSPGRESFQINYAGEFNQAFSKYDLVLEGKLAIPGITNFFGLGNNRELDNTKPTSFYRSRYRHFEAAVLLQKRVFESFRVRGGPMVFYYWNRPQDNTNNVLGKPSQIGLDSMNIYSKKQYLGGKLGMQVYNLNNELFPTRGVNWETHFIGLAGISSTAKNLFSLNSDMTIYASLSDPARVVAVIQMGGGHIFSKNFEYFQALSLGSQNSLRGFRKNRFTGHSLLYGGLELRFKIADIKSYVLPGAVGIIGFSELGRVWMRNESSRRWHNVYGGGLYFIPYNLLFVSATIGFSEDNRHLFNFSLGTKLNLTF